MIRDNYLGLRTLKLKSTMQQHESIDTMSLVPSIGNTSEDDLYCVHIFTNHDFDTI